MSRLRWGELGLGGLLGLELLEGVECLAESESGCKDKETINRSVAFYIFAQYTCI